MGKCLIAYTEEQVCNAFATCGSSEFCCVWENSRLGGSPSPVREPRRLSLSVVVKVKSLKEAKAEITYSV